jgi:thiamine transport system substrate-binding protein
MKKIIVLTIILLLLTLSACSSKPAEPTVLRVMTHDSFAISEEVLQIFESENNVEVQFLKAGDTGTALNKAILAGDAPLADVFYGVDNNFLSRALTEGIFESYESPLLADIPDSFKLDPENRALPVDYGDVCINFDPAFLTENNLPFPQSLEDLTDPKYKGLSAIQNPATSSPGLAFMLATVGHFGPDGYLDFWQDMVENDVLVVNDWESTYYTEFSRWGGPRPIIVSYSSSPAFEVLYAEEPMDEPPTLVLSSPGSCYRQIEFVGILNGTENRDLAEKWVDFMLSTDFQEDIPLQMFVFPVNPNAALDEIFTQFLPSDIEPAFVSPDDISAHREEWIRDWTEAVLR